jgi:hypothetical protein
MAGKRQIQTPGVTVEQNQEQQAETPDVNQDTSTKEQADAALEHITKTDEKPDIQNAEHEGSYIPQLPDWVSQILENQERIEQKLDAVLSQSSPEAPKAKAKGRFKMVEGKGHVWVEE